MSEDKHKAGYKAPSAPRKPWLVFGEEQLGDVTGAASAPTPRAKKRRLTKAMKQTALEAIAPLIVMGFRHEKIAETLGLTRESVKKLVLSPAFEPVLAQHRLKMLQNSRDALTAVQPFAIWTLMDLMTNGKSEFVREKAANDLLAHGKVMDQPVASSPGQEQQELLERIRGDALKPRTQVQVLIVNGKFILKEEQVVEAEAKALPTGDSAVRGPDDLKDDAPGVDGSPGEDLPQESILDAL